MLKLTLSILLTVVISPTLAMYYETLPKGIRMAVMKQVQTSTIESAFNRQKQEQAYFFRLNLDASTIGDVNDSLKSAFDQVKAVSTEAHNQLTFGEYQAKGSANVKVNGAGLAYGISDRLTVYGTFPYYDARVDLDIARTRGNNYNDVSNQLRKAGDNTTAKVLSDVTSDLPDVNEGVVQSVVVNYLNYQPLGNWQAKGMGDMEFGALYRLTDWDNAGLAMSAGFVLPTGRQDNPDVLQDFAFGDGQTDLFVEFGGGVFIPNTRLSVDGFTRYTYQFAHDREMRIPDSRDYPYGAEKGIFREKLGNILDLNLRLMYHARRWLSFDFVGIYNHIGQATYDSPFTLGNEVHGLETEIIQESARFTTRFSTVDLYKSGDFFLPFICNLSAQQVLGGMNTPKFSRYDVEFRFFF